jgi:hypothetical protein
MLVKRRSISLRGDNEVHVSQECLKRIILLCIRCNVVHAFVSGFVCLILFFACFCFCFLVTYSHILFYILNQIGGVKASVVASSLVDRGFESPLVHTKYIKLASVVPPLSMQH